MHAKAAKKDIIKFIPGAVGALGRFALLMDPVEIKPAEQELDDTTTENELLAALAVVLKVTPLRIKVWAPAAVVGPVYVKVKKPTPKVAKFTTPQGPRAPTRV